MVEHRIEPAADSGVLSDKSLRRDIRMLGFELGHVLRDGAGKATLDLVEEVRALAKNRRQGDADADRKLHQLIASLDAGQTERVIRALALYFDLANLAEDRHRVRVLRHREQRAHPGPLKESIAAAVDELKTAGLSAQQMQELVDKLNVELVFTAHPTEAKRRSVRNTLRRLRRDLAELDLADLVPREREAVLGRMRTDLLVLWETDTVRPRKPTVVEEVRRGLYVAEELWNVLPPIYRSMREALLRAYPDHPWRVGPFLRFGSWIGGDRDGNPFVTAEVTAHTLKRFREAAIRLHMREAESRHELLSLSVGRRPAAAVTAALEAAVKRWPPVAGVIASVSQHEVYRQWLRAIGWRLGRTLTVDLTDNAPVDGAYGDAKELRADVAMMADGLRAAGLAQLADGTLTDWLGQIDAFGFHLASLDIREDSRRLHEAIGELMGRMGISGNYADVEEERKVELLLKPVTLTEAQRIEVDSASLGEVAREAYELFKLLYRCRQRWGEGMIGALIVSMTHHPSDVLAMLWLSHLGAAACGQTEPLRLPISPLFETIDDLKCSETILTNLLSEAPYREHVRICGDRQMCMIGYSDSTKDGGYLTSNWQLYRGQGRMTAVTARFGVEVTFFHGRGGSLGRGGGPAARGILSLPADAVQGRIRITEQGEVMAERYDDPQIAARHLEQVTWATMLVTARGGEAPTPQWVELMHEASQRSYAAYRALVEADGFVEYFGEATPIRSIETLPIGSRPSRRRGQRTISDLRAIPYTFAWTQNRQMITAFYGLGAGLGPIIGDRLSELHEMYKRWPFFRALIDNAELALAKSDASIGREYAGLVRNASARQRVFDMIVAEHKAAEAAVLAITGEKCLLEGTLWLQRSIEVRNPYIDPLNLIQIELLRRVGDMPGTAEESPEVAAIETLLRLSVQGVAAGMRTTG